MNDINLSSVSKELIVCACKQILKELESKDYCDSYSLRFTRHYDDV
jgi:hypothetical protein